MSTLEDHIATLRAATAIRLEHLEWFEKTASATMERIQRSRRLLRDTDHMVSHTDRRWTAKRKSKP
jgi:hypothetical protein